MNEEAGQNVRRSSRARKVTEASKLVEMAIRAERRSAVDEVAMQEETEGTLSAESPSSARREPIINPKARKISRKSQQVEKETLAQAEANVNESLNQTEALGSASSGAELLITAPHLLLQSQCSSSSREYKDSGPTAVDVTNVLATPAVTSLVNEANGESNQSEAVTVSGVTHRKKHKRVDENKETLEILKSNLDAAVKKLEASGNSLQPFWMELQPAQITNVKYVNDSDEDESGPRDKKGHAKRVTLGTAIADFKLSRHELDRIPYRAVRNPHYRSAAPMRLYLVSNLLKAKAVSDNKVLIKNYGELVGRMDTLSRDLKDKGLPDPAAMALVSPSIVKVALGDFAACVHKSKLTIAAAKRRMMAVYAMHQFAPKTFQKKESVLNSFTWKLPKSRDEARLVLLDNLRATKLFFRVLPLECDRICSFLDSLDIQDLHRFAVEVKESDISNNISAALQRQHGSGIE